MSTATHPLRPILDLLYYADMIDAIVREQSPETADELAEKVAAAAGAVVEMLPMREEAWKWRL